MDMTQIKLTKRGKPVDGEPQPGVYYRVEVPETGDVKAVAKDLKKAFPRSFFAVRKPGANPAPVVNRKQQTANRKPTE